jgi:hypothetical protein
LIQKVPGGVRGTAVVVVVTDRKPNVVRHGFTVAFE